MSCLPGCPPGSLPHCCLDHFPSARRPPRPCVPTDPLPPWTRLSRPSLTFSICCAPSVGAQDPLKAPGQGCWGHSVCECRAHIWSWAAMERNVKMRGKWRSGPLPMAVVGQGGLSLRRDRAAGPQGSLQRGGRGSGPLRLPSTQCCSPAAGSHVHGSWTPLSEGSRLGSPPERCLQLPRAGTLSA